jgi:hypothetical protein
MARGWESKAVEDQVREAENGRDRKVLPPPTPAERERAARREGLLRSRARIASTLGAARDPRHREQLERALAHIDAELAALAPDS